ncbi:MAG: response regulator transcription factor [Muribaculaceae bacterium]|jgi:DNA-binding LytR/AlgR family response regulator|nr:response regulator transcription factor [Muribaculaceae bacterium]MBQ1798268.1 response regulator transcription factor [Muribaculaceae bacterium]MBQ2484343.1 response regulator transcription factor [Muribaculaceae bacterium]MBQ4006237.1 response regulator transcription factor [Muribaculaceae bacterium]
MNIKCAIVDDEPLAVELLASYVSKIPFLTLVGKYSNATDALHGCTEQQVDLLFLDIQMPELNGLELSRMVPETTRIVFTTAFEQYALDGYRINALDYLLKPISYANFLEACNKALQWFTMVRENEAKSEEAAGPKSIFVKSEYKVLQIALDDIRYIEGLKDYVKIYTEQSPRPILSLMSMKGLEEMLPATRFMRVHRSFIVNMEKVREIDRGRIVFGDVFIPVGDSYKQAFLNYIGNVR